jgi:hypothetical protein
MNYSEIKTLAYAYADRSDTESLDRYDDFLRITESNLNRKLKTLDSNTSQTTAVAAATSEVTLPADFGGVRRLYHVDTNDVKHNFKLAPPHMVDQEFRIKQYRPAPTDYFYAVGDGVLSLSHEFEDGDLILEYYRKVPPLTSVATTNWMSDDFPDAYVFGVRAEIGALVKNMQSAGEWEGRMEKVISEMVADDKERRWSGEPMRMRTE